MQSTISFNVPVPEFLSSLEEIVRKVIAEKQVEEDQLLTSKQVMKLYNISHVTLQKWRNNGKIPFSKVDNKISYSKQAILEAVKNAKPPTKNIP